MSSKITIAALAVLLIAVTANGAAFARNNKDPNSASAQRSSEAFSGGLPGDIVYNSQVVGRDPDQNIRVQILRDR
jgi:hypothetical protein